jgi:SAM-dependent methyltransferase
MAGPVRRVSYARQTLDSPNPFARFAHRRRLSRSLALADRLLPRGGTLLDFGAGEGAFLAEVSVDRPDARLLAVEPNMAQTVPGVERLAGLWEAEPGTVDLISALEVLEHLPDEALRDFLFASQRALRPGGQLLVTVPIMYGLALPLKEASRVLRRRRIDGITPGELVRATLGQPISRSENLAGSHKGFDFRRLRGIIAVSFMLRETGWSPFAQLPWWCNSQAMFVAVKREG